MGYSNSNQKQKKVFLGMSGGVDSSVAAALLKQQGYEVTGVYMKNWSGDNYGIQADCPWEQDQADVEAVCKQLDIPFRSFNFEKQYRDKVVEYFFDEYKKGRTPNPDVMCNKEIKFDLFLEKSLTEGADMIATGHYARVEMRDGKYALLQGVDDNKDQTYFLNALTQEQLSKTLFPVGHLPKKEVRKIAEELGLKTAKKPDSQGICFIGEINVLQFLKARLDTKPGNIVDVDTNEVVGQHEGSYFYTRGQRKGLGVGGQEIPYFVVNTDVEKNIVYVGHGHEHPQLLAGAVEVNELNFIREAGEIFNGKNLNAAVRYRQKPQPGKLIKIEKGWRFEFDEKQRAATPGQSLVVYDGEECVAGGTIERIMS